MNKGLEQQTTRPRANSSRTLLPGVGGSQA